MGRRAAKKNADKIIARPLRNHGGERDELDDKVARLVQRAYHNGLRKHLYGELAGGEVGHRRRPLSWFLSSPPQVARGFLGLDARLVPKRRAVEAGAAISRDDAVSSIRANGADIPFSQGVYLKDGAGSASRETEKLTI
jgi:hypothetical protein